MSDKIVRLQGYKPDFGGAYRFENREGKASASVEHVHPESPQTC